MARIKTALVGVDHPHTGDWLRVLERTPELELAACYDRQPVAERGQAPAPVAGLPVYRDLGELLANHDVEAALVLLPLDEAEYDLCTLAEAGVHVMAEKPVARTAAGLQEVAKALRPGTVFYSGYCWRYDAIIRLARDLVGRGILGDLWSIEMRWITSRVGRREGVPAHRDPGSYLFRQAVSRGGMLQWLGCHWIDLMLHVTGRRVDSVAAMTARQTTDEIEVEDTAACLLRFDGGMVGSLHLGYLLPAGGQAFLGLRGSLGWLHWDWQDGRRFTVHSQHSDWSTAPTRSFEYPVPANSTYGGGTGEALLHDFARCIRERGANPAMTIDDALAVLKVIDAAYDAAASGRTTAV